MAKLLPYPYEMPLGEAFQANDMKFAFLNLTEAGDFQMVHSWVQCREYFNELLMKNHHPEFNYQATYGFNYNHKEFPLDLSATRIAVKFITKEQKKVFIDNLPWIHAIEAQNNVDPCEVHDIDTNVIVLIASKLWIQKCLLTNIFTLMMKLAALDISTHTKNTLNTIIIKDSVPSEIEYVKTVTVPVFNNILGNCSTIAEVPSKYVDGACKLRQSGIVHAYSGILYFNRCVEGRTPDPVIAGFINGIKSFFNPKPAVEFIKSMT